MEKRIEAIAKSGTRVYDSIDSKRKSKTFEKEVIGTISDTEQPRVLFTYPLYLSEGEERKQGYVNLEDLTIKDLIEDCEEEEVSEVADFPESLITSLKEKPIENDNTSENIGDCINDPEPNYPTVHLKKQIIFDINNKRLGDLPNDYWLISDSDGKATIQNKASSMIFEVRDFNLTYN